MNEIANPEGDGNLTFIQRNESSIQKCNLAQPVQISNEPFSNSNKHT